MDDAFVPPVSYGLGEILRRPVSCHPEPKAKDLAIAREGCSGLKPRSFKALRSVQSLP
jgi:hypothetical protein